MCCHWAQLWGHWSWEEKDHRWACVDEPQAEFQRSTSNLGHNSHRSSGHEETLLFLSGLINMDGRMLPIYFMRNLLASLISIQYMLLLFVFFSHLREQWRMRWLTVNLRTFIFFTAVMLLVCMRPCFSPDIRFHYAALQRGCYRFNQGSNLTIATNHEYILRSICISHMHSLSSVNTEHSLVHLV